jgi:hydrogenase maturation protein HypF
MARRCHAGLARAVATLGRRLVEDGQARVVALSGMCVQNVVRLESCLTALDSLRVLTNGAVPQNDGGLASGQARP